MLSDLFVFDSAILSSAPKDWKSKLGSADLGFKERIGLRAYSRSSVECHPEAKAIEVWAVTREDMIAEFKAQAYMVAKPVLHSAAKITTAGCAASEGERVPAGHKGHEPPLSPGKVIRQVR